MKMSSKFAHAQRKITVSVYGIKEGAVFILFFSLLLSILHHSHVNAFIQGQNTYKKKRNGGMRGYLFFACSNKLIVYLYLKQNSTFY